MDKQALIELCNTLGVEVREAAREAHLEGDYNKEVKSHWGDIAGSMDTLTVGMSAGDILTLIVDLRKETTPRGFKLLMEACRSFATTKGRLQPAYDLAHLGRDILIDIVHW